MQHARFHVRPLRALVDRETTTPDLYGSRPTGASSTRPHPQNRTLFFFGDSLQRNLAAYFVHILGGTSYSVGDSASWQGLPHPQDPPFGPQSPTLSSQRNLAAYFQNAVPEMTNKHGQLLHPEMTSTMTSVFDLPEWFIPFFSPTILGDSPTLKISVFAKFANKSWRK